MQKTRLIRQARTMETLFDTYLEVICGARQDTLRIVSSLEAVVLNMDLLAVASAAGSAEEVKEDLDPVATQVRTLARLALSASQNTVAMIQANIPRAQRGAAKTSELVVRLTRRQIPAETGDDSFFLDLTEIKKVVRQVEEDAARCVAAARALLPQVENLQNRILALLPRVPEDDGGKRKKIVSGRKPGVSLSIVEGGH